jgi:prepilin-type N-terminal cleavage/methylation domain-containing protein
VPACLRACHGRHGGRPLRAFTLVEVLIVIVVISLLIAVIGLVGVKVLHGQKVALTEMTMRNVKIAIDRFAELDPLKNIYDRKDHVTFGPYPPYTLAYAGTGVAFYVDANDPNDLGVRLTRDLSGDPTIPEPNRYVDIQQGNRNDDIRALYTYLVVYVPDTLGQIPQSAKKPLPERKGLPPEMVNPAGSGTGTGAPRDGPVDVLGIYDAWGVPLDYFLYVKLEWASTLAVPAGEWRVTQRIPVLRSWGISREEYDAEVGGTDALDPELWIFSDPFPSPAANHQNDAFWQTGAFNLNQTSENGWARAIGAGDLATGSDRSHSFGYVP